MKKEMIVACIIQIYFCTYIVDGALAQPKISKTSIILMKGDIGMAKQVEQEAAYPIPTTVMRACYARRGLTRGHPYIFVQLLQDSEA